MSIDRIRLHHVDMTADHIRRRQNDPDTTTDHIPLRHLDTTADITLLHQRDHPTSDTDASRLLLIIQGALVLTLPAMDRALTRAGVRRHMDRTGDVPLHQRDRGMFASMKEPETNHRETTSSRQ